jgi:hypothetical protein
MYHYAMYQSGYLQLSRRTGIYNALEIYYETSKYVTWPNTQLARPCAFRPENGQRIDDLRPGTTKKKTAHSQL